MTKQTCHVISKSQTEPSVSREPESDFEEDEDVSDSMSEDSSVRLLITNLGL